jgi:hypothetical protein
MLGELMLRSMQKVRAGSGCSRRQTASAAAPRAASGASGLAVAEPSDRERDCDLALFQVEQQLVVTFLYAVG